MQTSPKATRRNPKSMGEDECVHPIADHSSPSVFRVWFYHPKMVTVCRNHSAMSACKSQTTLAKRGIWQDLWMFAITSNSQ